MIKRTLIVLTIALMPLAAFADTLYQPAPPPAGPGHPLRLGPDHRAQQIGDLVFVVYNFSVSSASSDVTQDARNANLNFAGGTGNLSLGFLRIPTGIGGQSTAQSNRTRNGQNSFVSAMMATVTGVLPSGVMQIQGDQQVVLNGQKQDLHVVGYCRPEDIDNTDQVLSSRLANVQATFSGDFQQKNEGLIRRVLDFLF